MNISAEDCTEPKESGWYIGRMKTWATNDGPAPLRVERLNAGELQVWQCGDERPWRVDQFEWKARIWP